MIIHGETWACDACVRGHRTGNCQHHDRPLQPIKKKGRPVSQCNHCRSMRQSRSAHVKCDCAKKLREGRWDDESANTGNKEKCRCFEDGRCICAFKTERPTLDTISRSDSDEGSLIPTQASDNTAFIGRDGVFPCQSLMPGLIGCDSWNGNMAGHSQLPQEQAHHSANAVGSPWVNNPAHTIGGDSQPGPSFDFSGLHYLSPPDDFAGYNTYANAHSAPLVGLPNNPAPSTQIILNAGPGTSPDWIHNGLSQGQAVGISESGWLESLHLAGSSLESPPDNGEAGTTDGDLRHDSVQRFPNT